MNTAAVIILFVIANLNSCVFSVKPGKSSCNLDLDKGRYCDDEYCDDDDYYDDNGEDRWYFDYKTKICRLFYYKGCGGNGNNFLTKEICKEKCNAIPTCQQPEEGGTCRGYFRRYYYNPKTGKCQQFIYGGCGGNDNNFKTLEECNKACCKTAPLPTCEQPKEAGPCEALIPRFYYCPRTGECEPFDYGGCGGNQNNFQTREECEGTCKKNLPTCQQPPVTGPCAGAFRRFYYNPKSGKCVEFSYGGCGGNKNNFETKETCEETCCEKDLPTCEQPPVKGPCRGAFPRFYYNPKSGKCEKFTYGGCGGNQNNFETAEECEEACCEKDLPTCEQPPVTGPCKGAFPRFYYNPKSGKCEKFTYGGCGGNKNNFETAEECEETCCEKDLPTCEQPPVTGPCKGAFPRFYYNPKSGKCEKFTYGGCGGNQNNFETAEECEETCCEKAHVPTCKQPKVVGPCRARIRRYFFNTETGRCEQFYYGGCKGNENNFETVRACEAKCKKGFCPRKENPDIYCIWAQNECCRDSQCRGCDICCNENCGNVCRPPATSPCDQAGSRVFDDPKCEIKKTTDE